jgi:hypothetical protein
VKVGKKRKGIRGMIWRFLPDGGNKIGRIRFWQHNQTGHIANLKPILIPPDMGWSLADER